MLREFKYFCPENKKELYQILKEHSNVKILAGGTDLLVDIRNELIKPDAVVDIKKIKEFSTLSFSKKDGLTIGAAVTYDTFCRSKNISKNFPYLVEVASTVASKQLRNRATLVGNICTSSPGGDMSRALLAVEAEVVIGSFEGTKKVKLSEFFTGVKENILKPYEVVEKIIVSSEYAGAKGGSEKLKRIKGHDIALVGVTMIKTKKSINVAIGACAPVPVFLKFPAKTSLNSILKKALSSIKPIDDIRASKDYRMFMTEKYIQELYKKLA